MWRLGKIWVSFYDIGLHFTVDSLSLPLMRIEIIHLNI